MTATVPHQSTASSELFPYASAKLPCVPFYVILLASCIAAPGKTMTHLTQQNMTGFASVQDRLALISHWR